MKILVFDTSSIISLVTNNLLGTLNPLKERFRGEFYIQKFVEYELVDKPLEGKMFKLEAMMVRRAIRNKLLNVYSNEINVESLLNKVNSIYYEKGKPINIVSKAEVEALALAVNMKAEAYVVDERTMRLLVEDPEKLKRIHENKLHTKITVNNEFLRELKNFVKGVKIIRSTELVLVAYEKGMFDKYLVDHTSRRDLVDALLWGLKLRGCSISEEEVKILIDIETR